jgi:hypothetical protein
MWSANRTAYWFFSPTGSDRSGRGSDALSTSAITFAPSGAGWLFFPDFDGMWSGKGPGHPVHVPTYIIQEATFEVQTAHLRAAQEPSGRTVR